uniref:Uncharacterized protein n=1 Tax=Romanomermis culicivorax TaxID=13658 RepID=A0A915I447_ROMCU
MLQNFYDFLVKINEKDKSHEHNSVFQAVQSILISSYQFELLDDLTSSDLRLITVVCPAQFLLYSSGDVWRHREGTRGGKTASMKGQIIQSTHMAQNTCSMPHYSPMLEHSSSSSSTLSRQVRGSLFCIKYMRKNKDDIFSRLCHTLYWIPGSPGNDHRRRGYNQKNLIDKEEEGEVVVDEFEIGETALFSSSKNIVVGSKLNYPLSERCALCRCSKRWQVAILANIGFIIVFGIRCNIGAAKVRMIHNFTDTSGVLHFNKLDTNQ